MARDVTGNPAEDSPLDAALCLSRYRQSNKSDERGENDESFHYQLHVSTKLSPCRVFGSNCVGRSQECSAVVTVE